jgi:GDP-D-mannose 3',5'-epimerase
MVRHCSGGNCLFDSICDWGSCSISSLVFEMKKILILGAAGFLGGHLEHRLRAEGHYVVSVARKPPSFRKSVANEFNILDLTNVAEFHSHFHRHHFDEVYQLAGQVGGLGYIGIGAHDADILTDSVKINLHTLEAIRKTQACDKIFFASSQCVYPDRFEIDPFAAERIPLEIHNAAHREFDASFDTFAFGQEKLFSEKLYDAYSRNYGLEVRIGRIGNTYGPFSVWDGDRAKAPAAICRKVAQAGYGQPIELWGDGQTRRSFTYVDDVIEGMIRLMASDYNQPVNIAVHETVKITELFETVCSVAGKVLGHVSGDGPSGVHSRGSDNTLCKKVLGWEPTTTLWHGLSQTYPWIKQQALQKQSA